ncbi:MAG TPA: helix-turn-helix domain-containing protein [Thermoanaerobaculia bacterium]
MLNLEVRKKIGGGEVHRLDGAAITIGASSGNEVVVRARGVAGRHVRISEKEGAYHLDLYKGAGLISVNGREFGGGPIGVGDRITIGEATITVLNAQPSVSRLITEIPIVATGAPAPPAGPSTEVEFRDLRLAVYRLCRDSSSREELATELTDFLDREFPPTEWAIGEFSVNGFRAIASTFRETPALPPRVLDEARSGERLARIESVAGTLTLIVEPPRNGSILLALLVKEAPRLAARAVLFLEEIVQLAGIAFAGRPAVLSGLPEAAPRVEHIPVVPEPSGAEAVMRQTDDLKVIVETVEREIIDRAMRRVEGNQSRGAHVLNISRGSLIAKLKEYEIPDYRYLRRERTRRY